jgi:hypothetical protein
MRLQGGSDIELSSDINKMKSSQYGEVITLTDDRPHPISNMSEIKQKYGGEVAVGACDPKHLK